MGADYNIFEGLTIRNADIAFQAGLKDVIGAKGLTVRQCRLEDVGIGVTTQYSGSQDFYIADNVMIGRDDRYRLLGWYNPGAYGGNRLKSYYAVKVYGSGHVVCHNYIAYFHDGIDVCTHGSPDPEEDRRATAIDFYNNDIHLMADDFIEADGGVHNIRILRNRGVNAAQCGLSAQPVYGGPAYYIRNVLYHVPTGCGLKFNVKPAGMVLYHNTIIAEGLPGDIFSNVQFRNNLFLGIDVRALDVREARAFGLGAGQGLAVTGVDPRGPASGVLEEGDALLVLDGQPVTFAGLRAVEARLAEGQRSTLVIQRGSARFVLRL
jgi:hypothetical protein